MKFSKKRLVITVVSHSFPHLSTGAIRDFENILTSAGFVVEGVRTKNPYIYRIGNSLLEFVGFDKPGKALGAARHILFINEANKMPFDICNQLIIRTSETVFLDWNPSEEFWFDDYGYKEQKDCLLIHSTFLDNIENLADGQIADLQNAKKRAEKEDKSGKKGYWYNWWRVYGLGLQGMLEGVIFPDWKEYTELPADSLYKMFIIDWGGNDPTTLTEMYVDGDNRRIYLKEIIYQPNILNSKLIELIWKINPDNLPVIVDSARRDKKFELANAGINVIGATKGAGSKIDNIEKIMEFQVFIHSDSENIKYEFKNYKWATDKHTGKNLNEPEDKNDHVIDPTGYGLRFYLTNIRPL